MKKKWGLQDVGLREKLREKKVQIDEVTKGLEDICIKELEREK